MEREGSLAIGGDVQRTRDLERGIGGGNVESHRDVNRGGDVERKTSREVEIMVGRYT